MNCEPWADAGLAQIISEPLGQKGGRNHALNKLAFRAGTLLHLSSNAWSEEDVISSLAASAKLAGISKSEAIATIRSGLIAGLGNPSKGPKKGLARRPWRSRPPPPIMAPVRASRPTQGKYAASALDSWRKADADGVPLRKWCSEGHAAAPLWPPDAPMPKNIRILKHPTRNRFSIVAKRTDIVSGEFVGIQLIHVDGDGNPIRDKNGRDKISLNVIEDLPAFVEIETLPECITRSLALVEGVADALAVASRHPHCAVLANLTDACGQEKTDALIWYLGRTGGEITIYTDGQESAMFKAQNLAERLWERDIHVEVEYPEIEGEDPASALKMFGFLQDDPNFG